MLRSVGYYQDTVQLTAVCIDLAGLKNSVRSQVKAPASAVLWYPCPGSVHDTEDPPKNIRSISGSAYPDLLLSLGINYGFPFFPPDMVLFCSFFKHITDLANQIPELFHCTDQIFNIIRIITLLSFPGFLEALLFRLRLSPGFFSFRLSTRS